MKPRAAVILVEDDPQLSAEMAALLETGEYELTSVRAGDECLKAVRERAPDLVLLSTALTHFNYLDTLKAVKSDPNLKSALIVLTASGDVSADRQAEWLEAGADDFIVLPVSRRALLARLQALIRIRRSGEMLRESHRQEASETSSESKAEPSQAESLPQQEPGWERQVRGAHAQQAAKSPWQDREYGAKPAVSGEAVQENETIFGVLAAFSPVGIFRTDKHGQCTCVNRRWCEMTGMQHGQAMGRGWLQAVHPEDRDRIAAAWFGAAGAVEPFRFECRFWRPDGLEMYVLGESMAETDGADAVVGHFGTVTDITELKKAEEALKEREEKYRFLAENSGDVLYRLKYDSMYYDYMSPSIEKMTGYAPEEICVLGFSRLVTRIEVPGKGVVPRDAISMNRRAGQVGEYQADYLIRTKDGEFRWVRDHSFPWKDASGNVIGSLGILTEVTERKQAEEKLRENEERFRRFAEEASSEGILIHDDGVILDVNQAFAAMHGYDRDELIGSHFSVAIASDWIDFVRSKADSHYQGAYEVMSLKKDGTSFPVEVHARDISYQGKLVRAAAVRDLTERKRAEEEIKEREEFLAAIVENIPDVMIVKDAESLEIIRVNKAAEDLLGRPRKDLVGRNVHEFIAKDLAKTVMENDRAVLREGILKDTPEETIHLRHGAERICHVKSLPIFDKTGKPQYLLTISEDITERKRGERALEESEKRYRLLFNSIDDALFVHEGPAGGFPGKFLEVNDTACQRLGYTRDEFLQMTPTQIDAPEAVEAIPPIMEKLMEEGQMAWEGIHRTKDGRMIPVEIVNHVFRLEDRPVILSSARDISERQKSERERERLEAQLRQSQKMEAIGTLAGGIAHDFNNILAAIIGYAELMAGNTTLPGTLQKAVQQLLKAAFRARDLVKQILVFSRMKGVGEKFELDLGGAIEEAVGFLRATLPSTIEIQKDVRAEAGRVLGDPTQIHQVLVNLCTNAAHAMENGGTLKIALDRVVLENEASVFAASITPGVYLRLTVSDTGYGMDAATLERIFDPYFTTKEIGKGSGLGLSVVQGIVKRHEGAIDVRSTPGEGTVFHVFLPAIVPKADSQETEDAPFTGGTERILLVDDERSVLEVSSEILEMLGYDVVARMSGTEALEAFRADPHGFDLVITDFTMPKMTGVELAGKIMNIRPRIPVILCTGFSERIDEQRAGGIGIRAFAIKPLKINEFAGLIRKVLDEAKR